MKNQAKKKERKMRRKKELAEIKKNLPNQNTINLTNIEPNQHQQSLLKKSTFFIATPKDVTGLTCVKILISLQIS